MSKQFTRRIENFICENCGKEVEGNGYTNHCPECLYSKHVDINPGDRDCICKGLMKPIYIEQTSKGFIITHQCVKCGFIRRNKSNQKDNVNNIIKIASKISKEMI